MDKQNCDWNYIRYCHSIWIRLQLIEKYNNGNYPVADYYHLPHATDWNMWCKEADFIDDNDDDDDDDDERNGAYDSCGLLRQVVNVYLV